MRRAVPAGVLLCVAMISCKSLKPYTSVDAALMDKPSTVYVTRTDGSRITLAQPVIRGDSLAGLIDENGSMQPRAIALSDVVVVAGKKGMSPTRLLMGGLVIGVLAVGEVVLLR